MSNSEPMVSVVMKVYNGEKDIRQAIDSILAQTYTDYELLVINDGSTDNSADIVRSYTDNRIRLIENEHNMGLCPTQNRVIEEATGRYIAVMDCDDISYPTRLEKQVQYLERHKDVMMCGSNRYDIVDGQEIPLPDMVGLSDAVIRFSLLFGNFYFTHSSIMFRRKEYQDSGLYYGKVAISEDYQVITEMARRYPIAILPERLVGYRIYMQSISKMKSDELDEAAAEVQCDYLQSIPVSSVHRDILQHYFTEGKANCSWKDFWEAVAEVAKIYHVDITPEGDGYSTACSIVSYYVWRAGQYSLKLWLQLRRSDYAKQISLRTEAGRVFLVKCIIHYHQK